MCQQVRSNFHISAGTLVLSLWPAPRPVGLVEDPEENAWLGWIHLSNAQHDLGGRKGKGCEGTELIAG